MQSVPCGCDGLAFLPFLSGSVDPDACPEARAAFFGARLSTTRAHFARSVMEAVKGRDAVEGKDEFAVADALAEEAGIALPEAVEEIRTAPIRHSQRVRLDG